MLVQEGKGVEGEEHAFLGHDACAGQRRALACRQEGRVLVPVHYLPAACWLTRGEKLPPGTATQLRALPSRPKPASSPTQGKLIGCSCFRPQQRGWIRPRASSRRAALLPAYAYKLLQLPFAWPCLPALPRV